jgi:tetratricopeptide (TPR) repeat protein
MRTSSDFRALCSSCVVLLVLLGLATVVTAQQPPPPKDPKEIYQTKLSDLNKKYSKEHYNLGKLLFEKKVYRLACIEFEKAIELDPNNADARQKMGFKKSGSEWVKDEKADVKRSNQALPAVNEQMTNTYDEKLKALNKKAAEDYFDLATWCEKNSLAAEALAMFKEAVACDKDHAKAREKLGYKNVGGVWVGQDDRNEQKRVSDILAAATEGEQVSEASKEEQALGMRLLKRRSTRFTAFAHSSDADAAQMIKVAEATRTVFYEIFEVPADRELVNETIRLFDLKDQAAHGIFIDKISSQPEADKPAVKGLGGEVAYRPPYAEVWQGPNEFAAIKDAMAHYVAHIYFGYFAGSVPNWLYEAVGYYFSAKILGTQIYSCTSFDSAAARGSDGYGTPAGWKGALKQAVIAGTDADIRTLMFSNLASLNQPLAVKGWSILDFMLTRHKETFFKYIRALTSTKDPEDALKQSFGWGYGELNDNWKQYVRENY